MPLLAEGQDVTYNLKDALEVLSEEEAIMLDMLVSKVQEYSRKKGLSSYLKAMVQVQSGATQPTIDLSNHPSLSGILECYESTRRDKNNVKGVPIYTKITF